MLPLGPSPEKTTKWFQAAAYWDQILKRPDSEYWFQLKPGTILSKASEIALV